MREKKLITHREIIQMSTEILVEGLRKHDQGDVEPPFTNRQVKQMKTELKRRRK